MNMLDLRMMSRITCLVLCGIRVNLKPSSVEQVVLCSTVLTLHIERKRSKAPVMPRRGRAVVMVFGEGKAHWRRCRRVSARKPCVSRVDGPRATHMGLI